MDIPSTASEAAAGTSGSPAQSPQGLRKFTQRLAPGQIDYRVRHNLGTTEVVVQTRIAGRIREGGIAIADENTVHIFFGGVLNEPMDVVIIG